ncbi:MAG: copper chaperone PCu(A)C [Pseudomonadota bacterium]
MKLFRVSASALLMAATVAFTAQAGGNHGDHTHGHSHGEHYHGAKKEISHDAIHSGVSDDGTIHIHDAWTRATVKTARVGGGYLAIVNTGDAPDRLVSVSTDAANRSEIHEMKLVDNVMRMRPLNAGLEIPPGGEIVLKPGAEHVMFMGLTEQLQEGKTVTATLTFEKAGAIEVVFDIAGLAAKGPDGDHSGHDHSGHDHGDHSGHGDHSSHSHSGG